MKLWCCITKAEHLYFGYRISNILTKDWASVDIDSGNDIFYWIILLLRLISFWRLPLCWNGRMELSLWEVHKSLSPNPTHRHSSRIIHSSTFREQGNQMFQYLSIFFLYKRLHIQNHTTWQLPKLTCYYKRQHNILRFDVSMDNFKAMKIRQCFSYVFDPPCHCLFRRKLRPFHKIIETASFTIFHD